MNNTDGIEALRRANPRGRPGFARAVDAARRVRADVLVHAEPAPVRAPRRSQPSRRWVLASAAGLGLTAAVAVTAVAFGVRGPTPGADGGSAVLDPAAALRLAAVQTSAAAEQSGRAAVRITKDGQPWAGKTVTWNGDDIAIADDAPTRPGHAGREIRIVDGQVYVPAWDGPGWIKMGSPENFDPDSGTTPLEILAAVREDTAGQTFDRITGGMTDVSTETGADGSVTYSGSVAAGLVALEEGFKEGQTIRVLPYGYVAHDEAANPATPLAVRLTVGPDHLIHNITATWGGGSAWTYTVTFTELGTAPPVVAPTDVRSIDEIRRATRAKR
jgi:hypothetical protein